MTGILSGVTAVSLAVTAMPTPHRSLASLITCAWLVCAASTASALAASAPAGDVYVDPVNGSDTTGNGGALSPWKTLKHAIQQPAVSKIHLAPGVCSPASGESFPLYLPRIEGSGPGISIIDGGGADVVFHAWTTTNASPRLSRLTLRNAVCAVDAESAVTNPAAVTLQDVDIEQCSASGVRVSANFSNVSLALERCVLRNSRIGVELGSADFSSSGAYVASLSANDCTFELCSIGVQSSTRDQHPGAQARADLWRCDVRACDTGVALLQAVGSPVTANLYGSLVRACDAGVLADGQASILVSGSTVADNTRGLAASGFAGCPKFVLKNAIVWGNQTLDVDPSCVVSSQYSDVGVSLPGAGNQSVDPLFVAAPSDYHLASNSPLLDLGEPDLAPYGLDRDGDPRIVDGDGDGVARVDMGYDERNPARLGLHGALGLGSSSALVTDAPAGFAFCTGVATFVGDWPLGSWGSLLLDPPSIVLLGCGAAPGSKWIHVPNDPLLSGLEFHAQSFAWQALPFPASFSNRLHLVIP